VFYKYSVSFGPHTYLELLLHANIKRMQPQNRNQQLKPLHPLLLNQQ